MPGREPVLRLDAVRAQQLPPAPERLGARRPARALQAALRDLAQMGEEPPVQVVGVRDAERRRALDLLDLGRRPFGAARLGQRVLEGRAATAGQRVAERGDDHEHHERADDEHVGVDRRVADPGLGERDVCAGDRGDRRQHDEVEEMASHTGGVREASP